MSVEHEKMDMEKKNEIAQERYGMSYDQLDANEKKAVGGVFGGNKRRSSMEEATGNVHDAYSQMSKEQLVPPEQRPSARKE